MTRRHPCRTIFGPTRNVMQEGGRVIVSRHSVCVCWGWGCGGVGVGVLQMPESSSPPISRFLEIPCEMDTDLQSCARSQGDVKTGMHEKKVVQ